MSNTTNVTGAALPLWHPPYSPVIQGLIWVMAFLLSFETIIGNAMVILAYRLEKSINKQISNRYIISLALSDLIIGLEGIPLFTIYVVNGDRWPLGSMYCDLWLFLDYSLCLVSILTVLLITIDRYMSVCKTATYMKWQTTSKTQGLIFISWIVSALIFGLMIFVWPYFNKEAASRPDDECYAPFLSNPYVNMSLYIIYYWTTLFAMLILYQGIHKAAKNLEKRAKAKEHRNIALLLTQRLGTQVGVSLMLQSKRADALKNETKDSGYNTNQPSDQPESANQNEKLSSKWRREPLSLKRPISSRFSFRRKLKGSSVRSFKPKKLSTDTKLDSSQHTGTLTKYKCQDSNFMNRIKKKSFDECRSINLSLKRENTTTLESISALFHDESLSSILQLNPIILESPADPTHSDNTSIILSRRLSHRSIQTTSIMSIAPKPEEPKLFERVVPLVIEEKIDTPQENGDRSAPIRMSICEEPDEKHSDSCKSENAEERSRFSHMFDRFRRGFRGRFRRRTRRRLGSQRVKTRRIPRSFSTSSSDDSSGDFTANRWESKMPIPSLTVTRDSRKKSSDRTHSPEHSNEPFLRPTLGVTRKISNISAGIARDTRERMISSFIAPISSVLARTRKRTKAEKRAHKAFRTITFIVGLFAILWSPYYIVATIYGFCKGECIPAFIYNLSYYMCYLNSAGNPFAYALANRQFRLAFMRILSSIIHMEPYTGISNRSFNKRDL